MITVTRFDHQAFRNLLGLFREYFYSFTPWTGHNEGATYKKVVRRANWSQGRPQKITAVSCMALCLAWYRFRGACFALQGWFGFTGNHAGVWLKFGRRMLLKTVIKLREAQVIMPDNAKVREYMAIIEKRHPSLQNVYCVADGLKLAFESTDSLDEQSMYYNGWQHGHYVTNLLLFGPDGRIIKAVLNAPGSVHDSTLAEWGNVYEALERIYEETGGKCCLDSAFASTNADYLIRSAQNYHKAKNAAELVQLREATAMRQAAEWGMRAIQGSFPRLKDTIKFERNGERKIILRLAVLLYNYRLEVVGLNQIRNVYVSEWSRDASNIMNDF